MRTVGLAFGGGAGAGTCSPLPLRALSLDAVWWGGGVSGEILEQRGGGILGGSAHSLFSNQSRRFQSFNNRHNQTRVC